MLRFDMYVISTIKPVVISDRAYGPLAYVKVNARRKSFKSKEAAERWCDSVLGASWRDVLEVSEK